MQFGLSTLDAIKVVIDTATSAIEGTRWLGGDIEYCAVVTLDVKNAFNPVNWTSTRRTPPRINTPAYLMNAVEPRITMKLMLQDRRHTTRAA